MIFYFSLYGLGCELPIVLGLVLGFGYVFMLIFSLCGAGLVGLFTCLLFIVLGYWLVVDWLDWLVVVCIVIWGDWGGVYPLTIL
jgi:hypothetical protein